MPKIFISHSWEDDKISRKLADKLRRDGAEVWIDFVKIKAGDSFIKRMNQGLEWCDTFILLWSSSAAKSEFVSLEWEGALANGIKIIPCLIDKTKLPFILAGRIYENLTNFDKGYISLAKNLNLNIIEEKPDKIKREVKEQKTIPKKKITKPKTEIIQPKITKPKIFRSNAQELSEDDVKSMLKKYDFFDNTKNETGHGFDNQYEVQIISDDNIVIDRVSGLMWQQSGSLKELTYEKAKKWVEQLNRKGYAGFHDWRLPTLEEAMSLMKPEQKLGDFYIDPVFNRKQEWIWTSDRVKGESSALAWGVNFYYGKCDWSIFDDVISSVRAVRSGQSSKE